MAAPTPRSDKELEEYYADVRAAGLDAPWSRPGPLIEPKKSRVESRIWRWAHIEPLLRRSAEFVSPGGGAERRILRMANPGVPERTSTHTISVALQYLMPGEVAPAHRHTPNAVRFMLRGQGAYTTINGEKCTMRPGDLVLTPSMTWHDHGNEGSEPVIWLDGLDSPIIRYLEVLSMQAYHEKRQPTGTQSALSECRYGTAGLRPAWSQPGEPPGHLLHYRWEATHAALQRLATAGEASPFDDVILEYIAPTTGKSPLLTIGCYIQMIRPGVRTRTHRHSSSAVYLSFDGSGFTLIDDVRYDWQQGDLLAIAPWAAHSHGNEGSAPAILFSIQDVPLLKALALYAEQEQ